MELWRSHPLIFLLFGLQILSHYNVLSIGESCGNAARKLPGVCVNIKECEPYLQLLQKYGTSAGNFLRSTLCGYENNQPIVCCPSVAVNTRPTTTARPTTARPTTASPTTVRPTPAPTPPVSPASDSSYGPLYPPKCGQRTQQNRIVGGSPAEVGSWPWMTALGYKNKGNKKTLWLCAGSLISARHVLTAAHCVYNRYDLYLARLGEHDLNSSTEGAHPVDYPIMRGTLHPEYNNVTHINDIAVLRLKLEVTFTDFIQPICLPIKPQLKNNDFLRYAPFIAGWGSVFFRGPTSSTLLQTTVPVVPLEDCKKIYLRFNYRVHDRAICAGRSDGASDACQGDSGGPMMLPSDSSFYVIGIISLSYRCAEVGVPAVYTKVSEYLDFILKNLN